MTAQGRSDVSTIRLDHLKAVRTLKNVHADSWNCPGHLFVPDKIETTLMIGIDDPSSENVTIAIAITT